MFKIIKNFNWIILSSFLCIFMGIVTFLTFINEGFIPLTDQNLQTLLIIDILLLLIFFSLIFKNFYRFYYTGKKNKKGSQTNLKYISVFSLFTVIPSLVVAIFSVTVGRPWVCLDLVGRLRRRFQKRCKLRIRICGNVRF